MSQGQSSPLELDQETLEAHPLPGIIDGDKESKGEILIIAGSRDVPGAALLAALGAMRAGAGKLRIATVESAALPLSVAMPEAMVFALPEEQDGSFASDAVATVETLVSEGCDAIVAGPGVKSSPSSRRLADILLNSRAALALDVALLHALEPRDPDSKGRHLRPVLLPNRKELASLLQCHPDEIDEDPVKAGLEASRLHRAIVLVKGVESRVVTPEGQCWTYRGGAPGLGVSGSGDVLSGIVGGLLARGAEPLNALLWAVWLHGKAGETLAQKIGPIGFLAREIPDEIPRLLPR